MIGLPPAMRAAPPDHPIAPMWHTLIVLVLIGAVSTMSAIAAHRPIPAHSRYADYIATMVWEWLLFAWTAYGVHFRGTRVMDLFGDAPRTVRKFFQDAGLGLALWLPIVLIAAVVQLVLVRAHINGNSARDAVLKLAPQNYGQLALWIALAITAGVVEEFVFRGYLQQQCAWLLKGQWRAAALTALLFGAAHAYQGIAGVVTLGALGAMFSVLVLWRRSLAPSIAAHAWQDAFAGVALFTLRHSHLL
jgi:membrane protease YdiL (CAAX protease family)